MSQNTGAMLAYFLSASTAEALLAKAQGSGLELTPAQDMHVTLAYLGEAADLDPLAVKLLTENLYLFSTQVAPLPASLNGVGRFQDNDPNALYANFDAPGLAELRALLLHLSRQCGLSPVLTHGFSPHVTLAYLPASAPTPDLRFEPILCAVDAISLTLGEQRSTYPLSGLKALSEVGSVDHQQQSVAETSLVAEVRLGTPAFAFKGEFVDVPLSPGVDYDALIAMTCPTCHGNGCPECNDTGSIPDPKPLFVVRPLGIEGAVSDNRLKYDKNLLDEIRQQVIAKKPPARQGHVSEESASYEFPNDVGLWVGARQVGDTLYGKCFIYRGTPFHQMVILRKAASSTLSNSIWGKGHFQTNPDGTQRLSGLELESIDFAPAERAALNALGGQFETTHEMTEAATPEVALGEPEMTEPQDSAVIRAEISKLAPHALHEMMSKEQRAHCAEMHVREMEPSSVYEMLPSATRQHCSECYAKEFGGKTSAAEMAQQGDMKRRVTELEAANVEHKAIIAEFRQKEFDNTLSTAVAKPFAAWNINKPEGKAAIASAKDNFKMFVIAEMAGMAGGLKLENIDAAADAAWPKYEPQAALLKTALSGGNVITGTQGTVSEQQRTTYGYDAKTGTYDEAAIARAKGMMGSH